MDNLKFLPLTPERFPDFEELFGARGACGGCWCMWWRLPRSVFNKQKGEANRLAQKKLVEAGEVPGILAYDGKLPIGWIAFAPRERYSVLENSRILKRIDNTAVWSVVCFYVHKKYRKLGLTVKLLKAAAQYVKEKGGSVLEGYPVEPKHGKAPDVFVYTGLAAAFKKAGFVEVARRSETRPIMRLTIT